MVAFRSSAVAANTNNTDVTEITTAKPSGTIEGDLMVAVVWALDEAGGAGTVTAPTGWILVDNSNAADNIGAWVFKKIAGASEPSNYTFARGQINSMGCGIATFQDASDVDAFRWKVGTTTDPSVGPDLTNDTDTDQNYTSRETLGFSFLAWHDDGGTGVTATASAGTEAWDISRTDGAPSTHERGCAAYYDAATTEGGQGPTGVTINPTGSITHSIHYTLAISDSAPANESWSATGIAVEAQFGGGSWVDMTSDVRYEGKVNISRGRTSESAQTVPSECSFSLNNQSTLSYKYAPNQPNSTYYRQLKQGLPIRVSKALGDVSLHTLGLRDTVVRYSNPTDRARASFVDAFDITGDLDARVEVEPDTWRMEQFLMGRWNDAPNDESPWHFKTNGDGKLNLTWNDGTAERSATSTDSVPQTQRLALRVTLDVDNGSSGCDVNFYYSSAIDGSWTQVGSTVTQEFTTSIIASNKPLTVANVEPVLADLVPISVRPFRGLFHAAELYDGIGGTQVASPDFTAQSNGVKSFSDAQENVWVAFGAAVCTNRRYRFHGEVSSVNQKWDPTGNDVYVEITASGVTRRLAQGDVPSRSAAYRFYTSAQFTQPGDYVLGPYYSVGYWPCEDGEDASELASVYENVQPMEIRGQPNMATYDGFKCSDSLPDIKGATYRTKGRLPLADNNFELWWLISTPEDIAAGAEILRITHKQSHYVQVTYPSTDTLRLIRTDALDDDTSSTSQVSNSVPVAGALNIMILRAVDTGGGSTNYLLYATAIDQTGVEETTFIGGVTLGVDTVPDRIIFNNNGEVNANGDWPAYIGHIALFADPASQVNTATTPFDAYLNETAIHRMNRIVSEEKLHFYPIGADGEKMGYQLNRNIMDLLREPEGSDKGHLFEPRELVGLGYRTVDSLYNIEPTLELDYSNGELSNEMLPTDDDKYIRNRCTARREGGSSGFTVEDTTSELSTSAYPDGVGLYDDEDVISLGGDDKARQHAWWNLHLGTVNELRFPKIQVALENLRFAANTDLQVSALKVDIGHRISVVSPPAWLPPEDVNQQVIGYSETFDQFQHEISYVCKPHNPYEVAVYDDTNWLYDTAGSFLSSGIDSTQTSFDIYYTDNTGWNTSASGFDIMVGGERMTVSSIADPDPTVEDSFDRANTTTNLGTADSGQAWTQVTGTWGIESNQAYISTVTSESMATIDVDSEDFIAEVTISALPSGAAYLVLSETDASNFVRFGAPLGSPLSLEVRNGGSNVREDFSTGANLAQGDVLKIWKRGNVYMCYQNDLLVLGLYDATESGQGVGMMTGSTAVRFNDFSVRANGSGGADPTQTFTVTRSVNGIVKAHGADEEVRLFNPPYRSL